MHIEDIKHIHPVIATRERLLGLRDKLRKSEMTLGLGPQALGAPFGAFEATAVTITNSQAIAALNLIISLQEAQIRTAGVEL